MKGIDWKAIDADAMMLDPPAPASVLKEVADRLRFPDSLRAIYAAFDGSEGTTPLLAEVTDHPLVWWKLGDVEDLGRVELDGRAYIGFASAEYDGELDDEDVIAIDVETEEIVFLRATRGEVHKVGDSLADVFKVPSRDAAASLPPPSEIEKKAARALTALLVDKKLIELRADVPLEDFAMAIARTLQAEPSELPKQRAKALLDLLEDPMVEEIFADDDTLKRLFREFV